MTAEDGLIAAIAGCNAEEAAVLRARAAARGVDPLELVAARFWLSDALIAERAARWAGLGFLPEIPKGATPRYRLVRMENLGKSRALRLSLDGRDVLFVAPDFVQILTLAHSVKVDPSLSGRICVVPLAELRRHVRANSQNQLLEFSRQRLAEIWPRATAMRDLGLVRRLVFVAALALVLAAALVAPFALRPFLVPLLFIVLVLPSWFRIAAIIDEPDPKDAHRDELADDDALPVYSVLIPLRDEAEMVPQLMRAMRQLDYPADKLDVKFVVEAASAKTVAAVENLLPQAGFELVVVPAAAPHTKPKALNFALPLTRGAFVVVYDAEDMPEPDQLRRTASMFLRDPALGCIQAELVPENARENLVTGLFASEYSGQFGIMLPGMSRWGFPMPLGGTSNHFRREVLWQIGGWDAYNVTEDADLGLRLARKRFRSTTTTSRTYEEAPVTVSGWFKQRTRWMKGWMQTFLVHNKRPLDLMRDLGPVNFFAFEIYMFGIVFTPPLHTLYFAASLVRFVTTGFTAPAADILSLVEAFTLVAGYLSAIGLSVFGLIRLGQGRLIAYQLLLPLYWAAMGLASFKAGLELVGNPYFWSKTRHGLSRHTRSPQQVATDARLDGAKRTGSGDVERVKGIEPSS